MPRILNRLADSEEFATESAIPPVAEDAAESISNLSEVLLAAVKRIEAANKEGDPILSAWLPDARRVLMEAGFEESSTEHLAEDQADERADTPRM
jgi:hypothetical protein